MNPKKNVLVAGANGTTGRIIVQLLKKSDRFQPIAMVRKKSQIDFFEKNHVTTFLADLEDDLEADLGDAVNTINSVIFAAGSKGKNIINVDQEGAKKLIDVAKNAGAEKFIMLSTMGADNPSISDDLEDYLAAKQNADKHLCSSGLPYTIVRPGRLTDEDGTGKIQRQEKLKTQGSISRQDVAKTLVAVLDKSVEENQIFEIIAGETPIEQAVGGG